MDYNDKKNKEGYTDSVAFAALKNTERKNKAFYVFKTMISVARLAGFYVNENIVIEDFDGTKYRSNDILHKGTKKPNV